MGKHNSVGRVLGCGSKSHRFKSCCSPVSLVTIKLFVIYEQLINALNGYLNIKVKDGRLITKGCKEYSMCWDLQQPIKSENRTLLM